MSSLPANQKLKMVSAAIDEWCRTNDIRHMVVCDEIDLRGLMLFEKNRAVIGNLIETIKPALLQNNIHLEVRKVRSGTVLAFSLKALSEDQLLFLLAETGEEPEPLTFEDKIVDVFYRELPPTEATVDFTADARRILETQRHSATAGMQRANQSTRQRQMYASNTTHGNVEHPASPRAHELRKRKRIKAGVAHDGPATRYESRLDEVLPAGAEYVSPSRFRHQLLEALNGLATTTGYQPDDLFHKFAKALAVLGQTMGVGPLQNQLKKQGIGWKKSDDGQAIILYIMNAQTNAPQPIARISSETLEKPNEFEEQLLSMIDFAKGEAPGAFKQKQEEIRAQEKAVRDIARSIAPQDPNSAGARMQQTGAQPAPQPATAAAAQEAGLPKSMGTPAVGSLPRRSGLV